MGWALGFFMIEVCIMGLKGELDLFIVWICGEEESFSLVDEFYDNL